MAKIMLVEDDHNLQAIYGDRLIAEGHQIVSAGDGEEALALAVKEKPDLIIADVMMPKISGFDMLDILRSTPETKNTKVIMMTALSQAEDKARADKLGANKYLVKSQVTLDDVARIVNEELVKDGNAAPSPSTTPATTPVEPSMQQMSVATAPGDTPAPANDNTDQPAVTPTMTAEEPASTTTMPAPPQPVFPDPAPAAPSSDGQVDAASLISNTEPLQAEHTEVEDQISSVVDTPAPASTAPDPLAPSATALPTTEPSDSVEPVASPVAAGPVTQDNDDPALTPPVPPVSSPSAHPADSLAPSTATSPTLGKSATLSDRVIQPLTSDQAPKPDLNQLMQAELNKEAAESNAAPTDPADPNNIAL